MEITPRTFNLNCDLMSEMEPCETINGGKYMLAPHCIPSSFTVYKRDGDDGDQYICMLSFEYANCSEHRIIYAKTHSIVTNGDTIQYNNIQNNLYHITFVTPRNAKETCKLLRVSKPDVEEKQYSSSLGLSFKLAANLLEYFMPNNPKKISVLQDWVVSLGLRHQGVLLTAVRGCDTAPKEDLSKAITRYYRSLILNSHCGNAQKAKTFIEHMNEDIFKSISKALVKNCDNYPLHYVMHLVHAAEIIAYKHPDLNVRTLWFEFYKQFCHSFHLNVETEMQLDKRLNMNEDEFFNAQ